jgi:hypothetical protein
MQRRVAKHEMGARHADVCAVEECADVVGRRVVTADGEAVCDSFETDSMAIKTFVDATLHFSADLMCHIALL